MPSQDQRQTGAASNPPVPEPVTCIAELMSTFGRPWALCGGWAIDAWLGRQTRDHGDIDISVFVQDQRALFEHLSGWQLVAHDRVDDGSVPAPLWDGRELVRPGHIHGRLDRGEPLPEGAVLTVEQGFILDIQLDDRSGDEWVLSREPRISLPLTEGIRPSAWGLPTVLPQVLLLFKATASDRLRQVDESDFFRLLPRLPPAGRRWLLETVALLKPHQPWLGRMRAQAPGRRA